MDMERLNRVLRRVRGEVPEGADHTQERAGMLSKLIRSEEESIRQYDLLRQRCSGGPRVVLTQLWNEERRHCQALQAEHLARYGDTLPPDRNQMTETDRGLLPMLGRQRERELASAEEYRRWSKNAEDRPLALLFLKHADEEERHAQILTQLLHRAVR